MDNDGNFETEGQIVEYQCENGFQHFDIGLKVIDYADNEDNDDTTLDINNLAPICEGIEAPSSGIAGTSIEFTGYATDVESDLPNLVYNWNFSDDSSGTGNPITHIFNEEGIFTVLLLVSDGEDDSNVCEAAIKISEPANLPDQEVAAYYNLDADFGEYSGDYPNSFNSGLEGDVTCEKVSGPENLVVSTAGTDCVVNWGDPQNRPTNDEKGTHNVTVKATDEKGTELLFDFDITVYSWIIPLKEGWNLISIPLVSADNSINETIINQIYDQLPGGTEYVIFSYQYNHDTKTSEWLKTRRTGFGNLDTVDPGFAYWIKVIGDAKLKGFGTQVEEGPGLPPSRVLPTTDWSLIGKYGILGQPLLPKKAGALNITTTLRSVQRERNKNFLHVYDIDDGGRLSSVEEIWNNQGYWLWIEDERNNFPQEESYAPIDKFYPEN